jgi:transglutaminase-like putative cysteine protease
MTVIFALGLHTGRVDVTRTRAIGAELSFEVEAAATVILQVRAATSAGQVSSEWLSATLDGVPLVVTTIDADYGGLLHRVLPATGLLTVSYFSELEVPATVAAPLGRPLGSELEQLDMVRPSRYCPSDHVVGLALAEFGDIESSRDKVAAIAAWINQRVEYVAGFSDVHDSAEHTLLTGRGVCRDFAHLGILLCRALNVPARFAAVYAPGLDPMDFHAVFEAWHDGAWWAYDSTRLVPRQTLVRVATGRDATDASFATVTSGLATLVTMGVTATSGGLLPVDSHDSLIALA